MDEQYVYDMYTVHMYMRIVIELNLIELNWIELNVRWRRGYLRDCLQHRKGIWKILDSTIRNFLNTLGLETSKILGKQWAGD